MNMHIFPNSAELGQAAAEVAALALRAAIAQRGHARFLAPAGGSQIEFLTALVMRQDVDWSKTELFHLDEYIGLPSTHPASFRNYLLTRLILPAGIPTYHLLEGEADAAKVCREVGAALNAAPIDIAFVGIGENGHLAFNDPPADFETEAPYFVAQLDEACRRQQVGEGWFPTLDAVPKQAITISVRQILKARKILCTVPDARKAQAVKNCLTGEISPRAPASALRRHSDVTVLLDKDSAALLPCT